MAQMQSSGQQFLCSMCRLEAQLEFPEGQNNDNWPVGKTKAKERTVDKFLEEPEEESKGRGTSNLEPNQEDKSYSLVNNLGNKFEEMLKSLSNDKDQIMDAKKFALDNANSAEVIVEILTKSFATKETSVRTVISRLTLLSNIIYSRNLTYQARLEAVLPYIILNFHDFCCNMKENLVAEILKERVLQFLHDWRSWSVYSNAYMMTCDISSLDQDLTAIYPAAIEKKACCKDALGVVSPEGRSDRYLI